MNESLLAANNVSHSSCLKKLEMQQVLKRIDKISKESSAGKDVHEKNTNNKYESKNFQTFLKPEEEIRKSTTRENPTDIQLKKKQCPMAFSLLVFLQKTLL